MIFAQILGKHAAIGVVRMKKPEMILHLTQTQGAAPNTNYLLIVIKSRQMKCLCILNFFVHNLKSAFVGRMCQNATGITETSKSSSPLFLYWAH